jgi:hypothetical protein
MFYNKKVICEVIDNGEEANRTCKKFQIWLDSFNGCSFHQELMVLYKQKRLENLII